MQRLQQESKAKRIAGPSLFSSTFSKPSSFPFRTSAKEGVRQIQADTPPLLSGIQFHQRPHP